MTWFISKLLPGTPFADEKLTPQTRAQLFEEYGLDEPLHVQYAKYMAQRGAGDLGNSYYFEGRPVTQMILERAPVSAFVGLQAVIFGLVIGLVLGIVSALRHNSYWDTDGGGDRPCWASPCQASSLGPSCSTGSG